MKGVIFPDALCLGLLLLSDAVRSPPDDGSLLPDQAGQTHWHEVCVVKSKLDRRLYKGGCLGRVPCVMLGLPCLAVLVVSCDL